MERRRIKKISAAAFTLTLLTVGLVFSLKTGAGQLGKVKTAVGEVALTYTSDDDRAIAAIKKVTPSVVTITVSNSVEKQVLRFDGSVDGYIPERRIVDDEFASGTGFFVHPSGYVVTNKHVVSGASKSGSKVTILTNAGITYEAVIASRDPLNDIAILKVGGGPFPAVQFEDVDKVNIGATVLAIGNALGRFEQSVTKGVLSATGRSLSASDNKTGAVQVLDDVLQTDAAINLGNSGGPLITLNGKVLGMNSAMENGGQSLAFAIPAYDIQRTLASFFEYGKIVRPYLGVRFQMVTPDLISTHKLPVAEGAFLLPQGKNPAVIADGPGDKGGLKAGDIIVAVDGILLNKKNSLAKRIRSYEPAASVSLDVVRGSVRLRIPLQLGSIDETTLPFGS